MAQLSNTHDRYDLSTTGDNVRESLANTIYNIDPTETPFQSMCKKSGRSKSDYEEWLIDGLATASTSNAHIDGDEFAADALNGAERIGNYHQISKKELLVTRRADKLTKAGRKSEMAYQLAKAGKELKRDMEAILTNNQAVVVGNSSTAPKTAGLPAWLRTNTNRGATGADPTLSSTTYGYPNAAATDGTDRALTEDNLLAEIKNIAVAGGKPTCIMVGPALKQQISKYLFSSNARVATQYQDQGKSPRGGVTTVGSVDYYVSDFGTLEVVYNLFQREDDCFILDKSMWELTFIDKMLVEELAKTGDAKKKHLICDYALVSRQEAASGIVADIDETAAMTAS